MNVLIRLTFIYTQLEVHNFTIKFLGLIISS